VTSASLSIVNSPCLRTSAVRVNQRTISYVSCGQLYVHCPSIDAATAKTAVQSFVSTRLDYCNSLMYGIADGAASSGPERRCTSDHRRSTARPHIACPPAAALASIVRQRVQFKLAVLVFKALHGQAPQCLTDVNSLPLPVAVNYGHLTYAVTCLVPRTLTFLGDRAFAVRLPDHVCGMLCQSASPFPWTVSTGATKAFI